MKDVPVLLLTGYLGSGKTTLVNRILANEKGIKFAVIVNDIGEVNIDADLIQQGGVVNKKDDSLVALQNGCICCTLKMDLVEQLNDIVAEQRFDYIVIEASGICEPAPIAQTICSIPTLGPKYIKNGVPRLDSIVTVVDALRMKDEFGGGDNLQKQNLDEDDLENLVIQQIEFCNTILLNKASEISPEEYAHLVDIVRALQPKAEIIPCDYGNVDLDLLLNTHRFNFDEVATSAAWIDEIEHHHGDEHIDDDDDDDDDSSQASNTDQKATDAATPPAATATPATPGVVKPSVIPVPPTTPAADENRKEDAANPSGEAQDTQESSGEAPQEERIDSMTAQTSGSQESGTEQITETSGKGTNAGRVAAAAAAGAVVVGGGGAAVYVTMIKGKFKFK